MADLIQAVKKQMTTGRWADDLPALRRILRTAGASRNDFDAVLRALTDELFSNHVGRSANLAILFLTIDAVAAIKRARREGIFRPSKYRFTCGILGDVISQILQSQHDLGLDPGISEFLAGMRDLAVVGEALREHLMNIERALSVDGPRLLKGALASLDLLFMIDHRRDKDAGAGHPAAYSKEQLAEGYSYIFSKYVETYGHPENVTIDTELAAKGDYLNVLVAGAAVREFTSIEMLVERFDYKFSFTGPNTAELSASDPDLEKACRLGFILNEVQQQAFFGAVEFAEMLAVSDAALEFHKRVGHLAVQYVKEPVPRYVVRLPDTHEFKGFLANARFFREEARALQFARKEMMAESMTMVADYVIYRDLTLGDLLRVQRLFAFLGVIAQEAFVPLLDRERGLVLQSIVASYSDENINKLLAIALPIEKIPAVLELLSWSREGVFDVQYQPFVRAARGFFVPINIMRMSNILRNILVWSRERLFADGKVDPIADLIDKEFSAHTPYHAKNWEYHHKGEAGEVDCLALFGDVLFAGEGKLVPLPASTHELRGTWDHVEKAVVQLDRFRRLFADPDFRSRIGDRLGTKIPASARLRTSIILSNRMFVGYAFSGHPVRGAYELANFLRNGEITLHGEKVQLWQGAKLSADDLVAYMDAGLAHLELLNDLSPLIDRMVIGNYEILQHTYRLLVPNVKS